MQWTRGVVDELVISRLYKGEYRKTSSQTIRRIGELAAAGLHKDERFD